MGLVDTRSLNDIRQGCWIEDDADAEFTRLRTLPASGASGVTTLPGGSAAKGLVALPVTGAVGAAVLAAPAGAMAVGFAVGAGVVGFAGELVVLGGAAAVGAGVFVVGALGGAVCSSSISVKFDLLDRSHLGHRHMDDSSVTCIIQHPSYTPPDFHKPARGATGTAAEPGETVKYLQAVAQEPVLLRSIAVHATNQYANDHAP